MGMCSSLTGLQLPGLIFLRHLMNNESAVTNSNRPWDEV